jgi:hypothetical protein
MTAQPAPAPAPAPREGKGLPFPLQDGEHVLKLCRRHWIFLWPRIIAFGVAALLPVILAIVLGAGGPGDGTWRYLWVLIAAWVVYWVVRAGLTWYRYHHDIWVITNQRLIDSHRNNPFDLRIATADLVNVQDMSVHRQGVLRTLLDYGDIVCQTAAEMEEFTLSGIPDPRDTQALVDKERDRERLRYRS